MGWWGRERPRENESDGERERKKEEKRWAAVAGGNTHHLRRSVTGSLSLQSTTPSTPYLSVLLPIIDKESLSNYDNMLIKRKEENQSIQCLKGKSSLLLFHHRRQGNATIEDPGATGISIQSNH